MCSMIFYKMSLLMKQSIIRLVLTISIIIIFLGIHNILPANEKNGSLPALRIPDTSFDGDGTVIYRNAYEGIDGNDGANALVLQNDGKIVITGWSTNDYIEHMAVWRYNIDGTLDKTFNKIGYALHNNAASGKGHDVGEDLLIQSDGKIVVTGNSFNGSNYDMVIWRYNKNGTLDKTFNKTGYAVHNNAAGGSSCNDYGVALGIQSDHKIVVAGKSDDHLTIWRYSQNGTPDKTFGTNGFIVYRTSYHELASYDIGNALSIQSDGKIVVAGSTCKGGVCYMAIWRFNKNGDLDKSFAASGIVEHDNGYKKSFGQDLSIQPDGKIVVTGGCHNINRDEDMTIWRYNKNGSPDKTFGNNGIAIYDGSSWKTNNDESGDALFIQDDGKIVVCGISNKDMAIWRYNPDGTPDTKFSQEGIVVHKNALDIDNGRDLVIQSNGKIVIAGDRHSGSNYDMVIWRYK